MGFCLLYSAAARDQLTSLGVAPSLIFMLHPGSAMSNTHLGFLHEPRCGGGWVNQDQSQAPTGMCHAKSGDKYHHKRSGWNSMLRLAQTCTKKLNLEFIYDNCFFKKKTFIN